MKGPIDREKLEREAKAIADSLRGESDRVRIRVSSSIETDTQGWCVKIGDLGKGGPAIELWLDHFTGQFKRRLYAGFCCKDRKVAETLRVEANRAYHWKIRIVTDRETCDQGHFAVKQASKWGECTVPVLETYRSGDHFFGVYETAQESASSKKDDFRARARAFLLDVAQAQSGQNSHLKEFVAYPCCENRKLVAAHMRRERSRLLAIGCKERDCYRCQICKMAFAEVYGKKLGSRYAEAHHIKPLACCSDLVKTSIEDLITVCANCHRMLHRMNGTKNDVKLLRRIYERCGTNGGCTH